MDGRRKCLFWNCKKFVVDVGFEVEFNMVRDRKMRSYEKSFRLIFVIFILYDRM